jgi:hypothetical protein
MTTKLRGNPDGLSSRMPTTTDIKGYGDRQDGTPKGPGFYGEISRTDDPKMFSSELSISVGQKDEQTLIPLLVPGLTAEEIAHLADGGSPTKEIVEKAIAHADQRQASGLSPFAKVGEQISLPTSANAQFKEGFNAP